MKRYKLSFCVRELRESEGPTDEPFALEVAWGTIGRDAHHAADRLQKMIRDLLPAAEGGQTFVTWEQLRADEVGGTVEIFEWGSTSWGAVRHPDGTLEHPPWITEAPARG